MLITRDIPTLTDPSPPPHQWGFQSHPLRHHWASGIRSKSDGERLSSNLTNSCELTPNVCCAFLGKQLLDQRSLDCCKRIRLDYKPLRSGEMIDGDGNGRWCRGTRNEGVAAGGCCHGKGSGEVSCIRGVGDKCSRHRGAEHRHQRGNGERVLIVVRQSVCGVCAGVTCQHTDKVQFIWRRHRNGVG